MAMITYLGMTMPMAIWSTITWLKNSAKNGKEVAIQKLRLKHIVWLMLFGTITTIVFYYILAVLNTPNIVFSTISITTSFLAASLTMLRSSYYAFGYALNDIVLILIHRVIVTQKMIPKTLLLFSGSFFIRLLV